MPDIPLNMNDLMMFIDAAQKILINFLKSINLVGQLSSRGGDVNQSTTGALQRQQ